MDSRFAFVGMLVLVVAVAGVISLQPSVNPARNNTHASTLSDLKPHVFGLGNANASALGLPLQRLGFNVTGEEIGHAEPPGTPVITYDADHVEFALYKGQYSDGAAAVYIAAVKNVGTVDVTVGQMGIYGYIPNLPVPTSWDVLQAEIVGCAHGYTFNGTVETGYPNGTTIITTKEFTVECGTPAAFDPLVLKPGESFSAYIVSSFGAGDPSVVMFSATVSYYYTGVPHQFTITVGRFH